MSPEKHPLAEKFQELPGSKPVERAVQKARREGEVVPDKKQARINAYLSRIDHIIDDERGWELLKHKILTEFSIDTDDHDTLAKIAHGLYESEKKLAIEQGRGADIARLQENPDTQEAYEKLVHEKKDIQQDTLSVWLDYLHQNDAQYPTWFRYFVIRGLKGMGILDKEKGKYSTRTEVTVAPFPDINSEALGFVYKALTEGATTTPDKQKTLDSLIQSKDFAKLYAFAQLETAGALNKESIEGEWRKYDQGSDHHILENELSGKGTGWCTASGSAYAHLQGGDFYVFYTKGPGGVFTEPRVAIRMEGDSVAEVRGVNARQELEPVLIDIATQKYHTLPGGEKFDKKSDDMRHVTLLTLKQEQGEPFTKDDLTFLYELNDTIEGFGYQKDPRIAELRAQRNPTEDAPIIFECTPEQIAYSKDDINENTKAYIGPLFPNIFQTHIEHIYTSFPEGKVQKYHIEIGGKTREQLEQELKDKNVYISSYAHDLLKSPDFITSKTIEGTDLVRLFVKDLGFPQGATTDQIYARAQEYGLELCPAEAGPHLRLSYTGADWMWIAMKQISDRDGDPSVFRLYRYGATLRLGTYNAEPSYRWHENSQFVFRSRKLES